MEEIILNILINDLVENKEDLLKYLIIEEGEHNYKVTLSGFMIQKELCKKDLISKKIIN